MSIIAGDKVEVQDRTGVEKYVIDGEIYKVIGSYQSGMLKLQDNDGFSEIFIPRNQVKKVVEDVNNY
ncbi:Hypothetical protein FORC57_1254 [Listeria monocytogenes]|uniref:hypothetical protein n=1 Tax=Listeria monocytogenes TaxID=1639 RepID=UPI0005447CA7|nr:hypothetical protein [Listeria monocytogenes]EIO1327557.1 hypothetical protein [Listeria innocua]AZU53095.1 Hypothetical protein FORC57_1254 [Listeria monocytogenes]EAD2398346.1 hypothetical protein [Listeria monocytogenes]EAD2400412.1 hypothetical protein [Listeria monocytogenes]EAD5510583.1 hypothetical protein [Listeria monocytogenes]